MVANNTAFLVEKSIKIKGSLVAAGPKLSPLVEYWKTRVVMAFCFIGVGSFIGLYIKK